MLSDPTLKEREAATDRELSFNEKLSFRVQEHGGHLLDLFIISELVCAISDIRYNIGWITGQQESFERIMFKELWALAKTPDEREHIQKLTALWFAENQ